MKSFLLLFQFLFLIVLEAAAQPAVGAWSNTGPINFPINVSGQVDGIGRVSQLKFHPTDPQKIYAVSASGGLYITANNGVTWTPTSGTETLPQTSCSALCIDYTNDQILYLCLGDANYYSNNYGIYKSTNGGATWTAANTGIGNKMAVEILMDPTNHLNLVAATSGGIWKTTNGGTSWTLMQAGVFRDMKAKPLSNTTLYAATSTQFYISTNFGSTWTAVTNGISVPTGNDGMRIAVSAADTNRVYLGTTDGNGIIMKSVNGAQSFTTVYSSSSQCLTCYDASVTSGSQGDYNFDLNCNPQNANELLLIAHCVWRSTDGGATWSKRTDWYDQMHTDMHHIEWNPYNNNQRWCANDGGVWMSTDPQATVWAPRSDGVAATEIYHAAQSPVVRELISIGTQDNGELYYTNGQWKCNRGGDWSARCAIDYSSTGTVWYLSNGDRRNLLPLGGDQSFNSPFSGTNNARIEFPASLPNTAFVGKDSIFRSSNINAGTPSWQLIKSSTEAVRSIASCTADSNILYVVTGSAHLLRSDNALSVAPTFVTLTTPAATTAAASVTTNKNNPNIVYLSCGSAVYRSTDKGVNWTNITGTGLSGLNIRRIIHDDYSTNERLFVNAGAYVHYKNNTATAWTAATGLPTVANATDFMIYNTGTAASILRLSTYGRGVWQCDINANLPPDPDFTADKQVICPGDTVHFTKTVYGNVTSYSWSFPGGSPATSTSPNPAVVYPAPGTYAVSLTATGPGGGNTITKNGYILVSSGQTAPLQEGFEGTTYPPTGWQLISNSGSSWEQTALAGGYGLSSKSITFNNYDNDGGGKHDIITAAKVSLAGVTNARLKFDLAYAPYATNAYLDTLMIRVSTDCGRNWTTVYTKSGSTLGTTPPQTASKFVPTSGQWRTDSVSLQPFTGNSVLVAFENVGHYGQAIYLDNININMSPQPKFGAGDTTVCAGTPVTFTDSTTNATYWSWSFPGGNPATATVQNPTVTYSAAGLYSVTLTAGNTIGTQAVTRTNYIQVYPTPVVNITANGNVLTANGTTATYQWYLNGTAITGATGSTYTAVQGGVYTVKATDANGCTAISPAHTHVKEGISTLISDKGFEVYPNPSTGIVRVKGSNLSARSVTITCYNATGAVVTRETFRVTGGNMQTTFDWSDWPKGIYELSIDTGSGQPLHTGVILR